MTDDDDFTVFLKLHDHYKRIDLLRALYKAQTELSAVQTKYERTMEARLDELARAVARLPAEDDFT